jgi:hypothetical protein
MKKDKGERMKDEVKTKLFSTYPLSLILQPLLLRVRKDKGERMKDEVKTKLFSDLSFIPYPSAFVTPLRVF